MLKTHGCGELRPAHAGQTVTLAGWVHRRRDHGGLTFIDLRDRSGLIQVVFNPETNAEAHAQAQDLRGEWVVQIAGAVGPRPEGTENPKLATGEIEVSAASLTVLNQAKTPPFNINEDAAVDESLRLQYRYLDLRRERMQANLGLRRKVVKYIRDYLDERDFWEIETPVLVKSTPEGARDYLVPSRLSPGEFYALPQSPQQLKQLLMVAGLERYYQIARCFRDEDQRADRQPEFTQLDLEMSFVEEADILDLVEGLFAGLVAETAPHLKVVTPFPRLSFADVMARFGTEKPDLRFGMELADLTDVARETDLNVFKAVADAGGVVKGFAAPGCGDYSRRQIDELIDFVKIRGARGLVPIGLGAPPAQLTAADVKSPVAKFLTVEQVRTIAERTGAEKDGLVLIVAADEAVANTALSQLRVEMGHRLGMIDEDAMGFAFVVGFPLMEWNEDEGRWDALHHPFTAPHPDDVDLLSVKPGKVRARAYDCVAQGVELLSGSIRIHDRTLQERMFAALGYAPDDIEERFGHMLRAFEYGTPPHGGMAAGIDRIVMLLAGAETIREVIPFPKTQNAADLLLNAPSAVDEAQLRDLHLRVVEPSPGQRA